MKEITTLTLNRRKTMKTTNISLRATEEFKETLKKRANERGMTITQYIVYLVNKDIDHEGK